MKTRRERIAAENHYAILYGDGPIKAMPPKRSAAVRDKLVPSEHQIQAATIAWWKLSHRLYGLPEFALFAIPNGGARDPITGARLKAEGVRRGIPDLFLAVQRNNFCGLAIELKRPHGVVSSEQIEVLSYLRGAGYDTCIAHSADEAREKITMYLRRII